MKRVERLRHAVRHAGGNAAVARRTRIPLPTLNNYLAGRDMKAEALVQIADACGVSIEWLAAGRGEQCAAPPTATASATPPASDLTPETAPIDGALIDQAINKVDDVLKKIGNPGRRFHAPRGRCRDVQGPLDGETPAMKMPLLALLALVAAAPAATIPPDLTSSPAMQAAEHEAEALLSACKMSTKPIDGGVLSLNDMCGQNQQFFIQQYVRALSGSSEDAYAEGGDYSEVDRAHCAANPQCQAAMSDQWIGIPADQVWACTWAALAVALEKPSKMALAFRKVYGRWPTDARRQNMHEQCAPLSMVEKGRAVDRTIALARRIADDPIVLPDPGWWLPWPTIAAFEGHS